MFILSIITRAAADSPRDKAATTIPPLLPYMGAIYPGDMSFMARVIRKGATPTILPSIIFSDKASSSSFSMVILSPITEAALDIAFEKGAGRTVILGGLGGRFDHSLGNLSLLAKYQGRMETEILDGQNRVRLLSPGEYAVPRSRFRFLSFVPYMGRVRGLTLTGVKYPLEDHTLTEGNTLGIGNEITGNEAKISFREGRLIMIESRDS